MPLIEWNDSYSVGLDLFDREHKTLVDIINRLYDAFERGVERKLVEDSLNELVEYTTLHFGHEEMYFDDWAYPDKAAHIISHQELRRQVQEYHASFKAKASIEMSLELIEYLKFWLINHILSEDKKFCQFLITHGLH